MLPLSAAFAVGLGLAVQIDPSVARDMVSFDFGWYVPRRKTLSIP